MSYVRRRGLGDAATDMTVNAIVGNGGTIAQGQKIAALIQQNGPSQYGNVPPQYASMVLRADGSLGPGSEINSFIQKYSGPNQSGPYWTQILAANRYLILTNAQGEPVTTIGAIADPQAAAILATYAPVPGDTAGRAVSTASTAAAETAASSSATAAKAATPVATTPAPAAPAALQTFNDAGAAIKAVYNAIGTAAQLGFDDGSRGAFVIAPINGTNTKLFLLQDGTFGNGNVVYSAQQVTAFMVAAGLGGVKLQDTTAPATTVQVTTPTTTTPGFGPTDVTITDAGGMVPTDSNGNPIQLAATPTPSFALPSTGMLLALGVGAFLLFRPRRVS